MNRLARAVDLPTALILAALVPFLAPSVLVRTVAGAIGLGFLCRACLLAAAGIALYRALETRHVRNWIEVAACLALGIAIFLL